MEVNQQFAEAEIAGETVVVLPHRALYLPRSSTLVVADPHWGKDATFRDAAIPIPAEIQAADLERLSSAIQVTDAQRLVILGDLLHTQAGQGLATGDQVKHWRRRHPQVEILLVQGNHDRHAGEPHVDWGVRPVGQQVVEPPFVFQHFPEPSLHGYVLCGHLHPKVWMQGAGGEKLVLACFWFNAQVGVLPAFGRFTDGAVIRPEPQDQVFVIADDEVISVGGSEPGG